MMSNWKRSTLGELVSEAGGDIKTGPFGSQLHQSDYVDDPAGVPVVMPKDMIEGRVNYATTARISREKAVELGQHITRQQDVLLPRRGDLDRRVLIRDTDAGVFCGTGSLRVRLLDSRLLPEFLYYYLATAEGLHQLESKASGVTMPNISTSAVQDVEITFPSQGTQQAIASILMAYDELIENNLRRIETLEEMAQAIYREWFVNFRFPDSEDTTSSAEVAPDGWDIGHVTDVVDINPRTKIAGDQEHPFVGMGNLLTNSMLVSHVDQRSAESGLSRFARGDTLFPGINPSLQNGKTAFVQFLRDDQVGLGSTEFIVLRGRGVPPEWVYCLARTPGFRDTAIASMTGASGRQRVKKEAIAKYDIAIPPAVLGDRFGSTVRPMFRLVEGLRRQNENLRTTRDLLLPKLISGEIDVSELDIDTSWLAA